MLVSAWIAALGLSCAVTDDGPELDRGANPPVSASSDTLREGIADDDAIGFDTTIDKGLRKHFCCAIKTGSRVDSCYDLTATKVIGETRCALQGTGTVLRDGNCNQYPSCKGKLPCFEEGPDGLVEIPCR